MDNFKRKIPFYSRKVLFGATVGTALLFMVIGVIFWGGFNTAMEATNTLTFCISCHEMEENVYQEYTHTVHFANRSGVRATCSDCHVPDPWVHKVVRKIKASNELLHKALGTIDTPEKFEDHRLRMATNVWNAMKDTDSRECRNCHDWDSMDPATQQQRSIKQHVFAMNEGQTCIDCHKGIAHKKPDALLDEAELDRLEAPNPAHRRDLPPQWVAFLNKAEASEAPALATKPAMPAAPERTTPPAPQPAPAATGDGEPSTIDWNQVAAREIVLFYPGQTSMEWTLNGRMHGGARVYTKVGDRCLDCHEGEEADMGKKMVTGEKAETSPIPGKRPAIPVQVQAAHDGEHLYMRFGWPDTAHVAIPFADGGKMDPENAVKLALMIGTDEVEQAGQSGCWGSCHHDAEGMPDAPADQKVTKYLAESRTDMEMRKSPLGGWDKRKPDAEIEGLLQAGHYLDLMRYKAGSGLSQGGHVLADRVMEETPDVQFQGERQGDRWVVTLKRPLAPGRSGDLDLQAGQLYNIGFAIHDDYTAGRFHHVSLGYKFGLDHPEAEINAVGQ
ncbi:MAG: NapC/NirT family cytochrome c [Gammaproteobacteria bacterium]|nr:NapC/NirT family cytochrome c [Gammaproteobacteria bacterium]MCW9059334.1 NapC/NirT family cytochrome c [Gammaproteobacteria bacterium]